MSLSQIPVKNKSEPRTLLTISAYREEVLKTKPHTHGHYLELIFFNEGAGFHTIDETRYEVAAPVIFLIRPGQVHFLELDGRVIPKGFVLILKPEFLIQSTDLQLRRMIHEISSVAHVSLSSAKTIQTLFELITAENNASAPIPLLESLLKALFIKIGQDASGTSLNVQNNLYLTFRDLLEKQLSLKNTVAHYAGLLYTTPQNLNAACRKYGKRAASSLITERVNNEARRLLAYSGQTVAEIAFGLDFSDPSHFTRYFKRHNGVTPQQYRLQLS